MKKYLFVFVFAFIGITSTYAKHATREELQIKVIYVSGNISINKPEMPANKKMQVKDEKNGAKCTANITIKSDNMEITMTATAPTCAEAYAAARKVADAFQK